LEPQLEIEVALVRWEQVSQQLASYWVQQAWSVLLRSEVLVL
jgi:hypothetical protein